MKSLSLTQPHALMVIGVPGSGKTHFAEQFADTFNAPYFNIGTIAEQCESNESATALVYNLIKQVAKTKQSLIIEPATGTRRERAEYTKLLKAAGYTPLYIWIQTDAPTAQQRAKRSRGLSTEGFNAEHKAFTAPLPADSQVVISGKHTYATQARVVLKRLSAPRAEISTHRKPLARQSNIKIQ